MVSFRFSLSVAEVRQNARTTLEFRITLLIRVWGGSRVGVGARVRVKVRVGLS